MTQTLAEQLDLYLEPLEQRFWTFDKENPHVYRKLVALARRAKDKGIQRYSVYALFHVLRWEIAIETSGKDEFLINNNFGPFYSRLIMDRECDLAGFFETRKAAV